MTLRAAERDHEYHRAMHEVVQRLERLLTLLVLLLLGMALTTGLLGQLDWRGVLVAVGLVFLVGRWPPGIALSVGRGRRAQDCGVG